MTRSVKVHREPGESLLYDSASDEQKGTLLQLGFRHTAPRGGSDTLPKKDQLEALELCAFIGYRPNWCMLKDGRAFLRMIWIYFQRIEKYP